MKELHDSPARFYRVVGLTLILGFVGATAAGGSSATKIVRSEQDAYATCVDEATDLQDAMACAERFYEAIEKKGVRYLAFRDVGDETGRSPDRT